MDTMCRLIYFFASLLLGLSTSVAASGEVEVTPVEAERLFVREVLPLLKTKCFACHGDDPDDVRADLDLRSREAMLKGSAFGPVLVPGSPDESAMYIAIKWEDGALQMPPKENDRLSDAQIEVWRKWILGGAPWVAQEKRAKILESDSWFAKDGVTVKTSGGLSREWTKRRYKPEDLWAFAPMKRYSIPNIEDVTGGGTKNPVDAFVHQRLQDAGITPAGRADKRSLIRRATFDLIGLPPTPEEIEAFVNDASKKAFEKVVDRLLKSPQYGERWGRNWLDVVRYADTAGYSNDFERPNAWRYRDYVIRSFNADKPYNRFVIEQLAGDEFDPNNPEMLIAVGYLRSGPWEQTGMSVAAETRQLFLDDVTNSVGETFLSIPLRCARCHDHKFDPIPTRDYYRMQAVFAPVQFAERNVPYLPAENQNRFGAGRLRIESLLQNAIDKQAEIRKKEENATRKWMEERGMEYLSKRKRSKLPDDKRLPRFIGLTHKDLGTQKVLAKQVQRLSWEKDRYKPIALSIYNGPLVTLRNVKSRMMMPENLEGELQKVYILGGGSVYAPTEPVSPGVISAVYGSNADLEPSAWNTIPETTNGRRLALANWIANSNNPLATRSIVNRIWQWHFGRGIAGNSNNFGVMGKKPTHPELLDWLTLYFVEHGWSFKTMHRLIMNSETYQRGERPPDRKKVEKKDPSNKLLSYFLPRRLTAEELRDGMLFVSGELNLEMGGLPIFPEINMEVALQPRHVMGSVAPAHQPSRDPTTRNRRTVYAYRYRGLPDPMLEVFNQPTADLSCERRTTSTITPQVFTLFNSQNSYDRALAMAHRVERESASEADQIERAFKLAWGRAPTVEEYQEAVGYLKKAVVYHRKNSPQVQTYATEVTRRMFEEMTGEAFEFVERLDVYEDYVPDLKSWDVQAETRALADLCLVLFNSNEFVYVY